MLEKSQALDPDQGNLKFFPNQIGDGGMPSNSAQGILGPLLVIFAPMRPDGSMLISFKDVLLLKPFSTRDHQHLLNDAQGSLVPQD